MAAAKAVEAVPVNRIFLWLNNPRHNPFNTEAEAIEFLCQKEDVYPLARDIAKHGLNPLERMAIFPINKRKASKSGANYYVAEGNRRICAVKLLHDPDRAPANMRKAFQNLSDKWTEINSIPAAVFGSADDVKLWLDRVHNGPQGGIGRRPWHSEQKARFDGRNKNKLAQELLDYAEAEKMISARERRGKLTTVQRFLINDIFREALGFDPRNPDMAARIRSNVLIKRFVQDLVGKETVNSRMNKEEVKNYARLLSSTAGVTTQPIDPASRPSDKSVAVKIKTRRNSSKKPEKTKNVSCDDDIFGALQNLGNRKLESLYHSICDIDLDRHTPILAVGAWSFFECLTACGGRNDSTSFLNYLSKNKLTSFGLRSNTTALQEAMSRVSGYGNTTKHHAVAATFNGDQLNNDFLTLQVVILKCIEEAITCKTR